jgi:biopolymer transport protein TolR
MAGSFQPMPQRSRRRGTLNSSVNITPLVDVMLVLMVIFMVAAPMLNVGGISVDLPKSEAKPLEKTQDEPVIISMSKDEKLFIQDADMPFDQLVKKLQSLLSQKPDLKIYLKADQSLSYGQVMNMMGALSKEGLSHISLIVSTT